MDTRTVPSTDALTLLIPAHADQADALTAMLTHLGKRVRVLTSLAGVIEALADRLSNEPVVLLVDMESPLLDGILERVRAIEVIKRPYVILLGAETAHREIIRVLSQGAEDFLLMNADYLELVARLHVAERSAKMRYEMASVVDSLEELCRRHDLLGEFVRRRIEAQPSEQDASPAPPEEGATPYAEWLREVSEMFGLANVRVELTSDASPSSDEAVVACSGLVSSEPLTWKLIDISSEPSSLAALYEAMLGEPPQSATEAKDALAEFLNNAQGMVKMGLVGKNEPVLGTTIPTVVSQDGYRLYEEEGARHLTYVVAAGDIELYVTITETLAVQKEKEPRHLRCGDILCHDVGTSAGGVPLLKKGTTIVRHHLQKLVDLESYTGCTFSCTVVEPVPVTDT